MSETIAAIATAYGEGSISIIRLSGDDALAIALKLISKKTLKPRHATLASIYNTSNELLDQAIVIYFKNPNSFTGEDIVEFQCHGGLIVSELILKASIEAGARLATPGEFSKRAFLNGRIDLSEAEAIAGLIEAKSEDAAKILALQMKGSLKNFIGDIRDKLVNILAYSEVSIDYAEEDLPQSLIDQIKEKLTEIKVALDNSLKASSARSGLMQGFRVSIIGKPNVGKSSLLNALLSYDRAIVSDIAGTTRDTIEEQVKIGTHLIRLIDTAGIRESSDEIEKIGIERSKKAIEESDIVISLFDSSKALDEDDDEIIKLISEYKNSKEILVFLNKSDLEQVADESILKDFKVEKISAKNDAFSLYKALETLMNKSNISDEVMLISTRQNAAVQNALNSIDEAYEPLDNGELEFFSFHINDAIKEISSISRPYEYDQMLDEMFGNFCLGK